ncbi:NAD(P)-dependent oxidoreductase [Stakelama sp. CBK3Z-3]|uniref:NAD(P)-dependent oxidoreductase n=1 Tax=Stakelama flava TaxID=2860338 RepID=A0ABS6XIP3_9SPHN|nr:NAD(P)-dependent oxidoreductase [Stakelama flava]MBW4330089.1 NAD(P)-dependent oxidoreductase [Stakelama flava]
MSVSVVGLGKIGSALVPRLLCLNQEITVWNRSSDAMERAAALGAHPVKNAAKAFAADIVLTALFDDAAVRDIVTPDAISLLGRNGALHICLSTLSPGLTQELAAAHRDAGAGYVAAPLFGRPEAVAAGAANICVAGDRSHIETGRAALESFGRVWNIGEDPRLASVAKLCGNFMIGAAIGAMAETAGIMAAEQGDAEAFLAMMTQTLFSSPIYSNYAPSILGVRPLPASGLDLPLKDLELLAHVADRRNVPTGLLRAMLGNLSLARDNGLGREDWSVALSRLARRQTDMSRNSQSVSKER